MVRTSRQSKILELITRQEIETQEELVAALRLENIDATQATISRDIKELGLIKIMTENRKYKYAREAGADFAVNNKMINVFRESVISFDYANNIVVVKTLSGSANAACLLIDKINHKGILGSVAGDDTVIIVLKSQADAEKMIERMKELVG